MYPALQWYFRSKLDMYSALVGCVLAEARPAILRWYSRSEGPVGTSLRSAGLAAIIALHWTSLLGISNRREYNAWHPYTSWIIICAFICLRNVSFGLRRTHSTVLALMGRHSLELYLLQFHVWLGASAKTNVVPVPTMRAVSAAGMSFVFAISAGIAFRATSAAVLWLTSNKRAALVASGVSLLLLTLSPVIGGF